MACGRSTVSAGCSTRLPHALAGRRCCVARRPSLSPGAVSTAAWLVRRTMAAVAGSDSAAAPLATATFFLDAFALRQWDDPLYGGTRLTHDKEDFMRRVQAAHDAGEAPLIDGYADFCKHVIVPSFTTALVGALPITDANRKFLQSGYTRRRPEELAVLTRWFRKADVDVPTAKYLDVILYSREQLVKEYAAMPVKGASAILPDVPWGIISIKAQDEPYETPMQPITQLRNALGREEGGSGVPLDKEAYEKAVQFWEAHATIVDGAKPNGE